MFSIHQARILFLGLLVSSASASQAGAQLEMSVQVDRDMIVPWDIFALEISIRNAGNKPVQIYFINTYVGEHYLRVETTEGELVPHQSPVDYMHEAPSFHLIEPGESLVKEQVCFSQLKTNGDYKLNIFDVEYLLNDLKEIKLSGTFECSERSVEHYRSRFTDPTGKKAEFWTGKIESPTITLAVDPHDPYQTVFLSWKQHRITGTLARGSTPAFVMNPFHSRDPHHEYSLRSLGFPYWHMIAIFPKKPPSADLGMVVELEGMHTICPDADFATRHARQGPWRW